MLVKVCAQRKIIPGQEGEFERLLQELFPGTMSRSDPRRVSLFFVFNRPVRRPVPDFFLP